MYMNLQLVTGFAALVNGGRMVRPMIAASVSFGDGGKSFTPRFGRQVISKRTSDLVRRALAKVVSPQGTGRRAISRRYSIGGKTGTAQVPGLGGYLENVFNGSFACFAPVENPRVVVLVSLLGLDKTKGDYYGGGVAAPAAKTIIEETLTYLRVPRRRGRLITDH